MKNDHSNIKQISNRVKLKNHFWKVNDNNPTFNVFPIQKIWNLDNETKI